MRSIIMLTEAEVRVLTLTHIMTISMSTPAMVKNSVWSISMPMEMAAHVLTRTLSRIRAISMSTLVVIQNYLWSMSIIMPMGMAWVAHVLTLICILIRTRIMTMITINMRLMTVIKNTVRSMVTSVLRFLMGPLIHVLTVAIIIMIIPILEEEKITMVTTPMVMNMITIPTGRIMVTTITSIATSTVLVSPNMRIRRRTFL